jgi:glucose/arabinose dehydrogenase/chitodextrinase
MRLVLLAVVWLSLAAIVAIPPPAAEAAGQINVYMGGLNFPIALGFSTDGRIFFAERFTGSIRIIESGLLLAPPFYTLTNTATAGERGLLGLALDPGFPTVPWVYAYQTYNDVTNGTVYNRIVRIQASGNVGTSMQVILRMPPLSGATNHNGGVIAFGPDGMLYAVVGENANIALAQNPMSPMGKVLRMNPDGSPPADNPFYGNLAWDNLVYSYGHRNMFGLAFHPVTDGAYVTENGPGCNDEVNLLASGGNFGWGTSQTCTTPPLPPDNTNQDGPIPRVPPITWWGGTICPTNAAIYGGPFFPGYQGDLFMGDCNFRRLHRLDLTGPNYDTVASDTIVWTAPSAVIEVEQGPDGAIWFTTPSTIYRYWDSAQQPTAAFTATPNPVNVGVSVTFDGSASADPDGTIVSHAWDFGDATTATGMVAGHAYLAAGTYTATLTVTDNETFTDTATLQVDVQSTSNALPVSRFTASPATAYIGVPIVYNGTASSDPDGMIVAYAWDFGDGNTATGAVTSHSYVLKGTFTVLLTVTDDVGGTNVSNSDIVIANRAPVITATDPTIGTMRLNVSESLDLTVTAVDPDFDPLTYTWRVNGTVVGTGTGRAFLFTTPGTYVVNVTVSDGTASDSREWRLNVVEPTPPPADNPSGLAWWWGALVLVIAAVGVLLFLVWRRRRDRQKRAP